MLCRVGMATGDLEQAEVDAIIASIAPTPIAAIVTDFRRPDNPIIAANDAFCALTGYTRDEIVGRNCRFLSGERTERAAQAALGEAVAAGRAALVELTNYRKDGTAFHNAVMIAPVRDSAGRVALFVGSQMEVAGQGADARKAAARRKVDALTLRQRQVLAFMSAGYRNKQIGGVLGIDEKTVKMHRARMLQALGLATSAEAIRVAVEAELTPDGVG